MGKDVNSVINTCFFSVLLQLVRIFFRTKWSTTEQASNDTVATKSWRYLFANPDRYIIINEVIFSFYSLFYA